jgi:uncharacterized protein (UPF0335 family)
MSGSNSGASVPEDFGRMLDRACALEQEKRDAAEGLKDLMVEAKAKGYDVPALRHVIKLRMLDAEKRAKLEEKRTIQELYESAAGIFA